MLVQTLPGHKIWLYKKRYYAVPLALGEVDLDQPGTADLPGVFSADDETVLLVELEHSKSWANSRGQYDAQERQRIAGSLYRAGSAIGDERHETAVAPRALIVKLNGEFIAMEPSSLTAVDDCRRASTPKSALPSYRQGYAGQGRHSLHLAVAPGAGCLDGWRYVAVA